jgi:hypothetical protein
VEQPSLMGSLDSTEMGVPLKPLDQPSAREDTMGEPGDGVVDLLTRLDADVMAAGGAWAG